MRCLFDDYFRSISKRKINDKTSILSIEKKNGISIFNVNTSVYTSILVYPLYRENRVKSPPRKYTVRCTVIFYGDTFHFVDINKSFLEGKLVGVWTEEESQRVTALIKIYHRNNNEKCYNKEDGKTYLISINLRQGVNRDQTCSFILLIVCRYLLQTRNGKLTLE